MESQRLSESFNEMTDNAREYVQLKIDLLKLTFTEKLSLIASTFMVTVILFLVFLFVTMFLSVAFIFWYKEHVGSFSTGALIVGSFYLLIGVIVFLTRHHLFVNPLISQISKAMAEEEDENK